MRSLRLLTFCLVIWLGGCTDNRPISKGAFTRDYVMAIKKTRPDLNVEVIGDSELKITTSQGKEMWSYLDNAYNEYKHDPNGKADIFQRYISSFLETHDKVDAPVDRKNIVPIVSAFSVRSVMPSGYVSSDFSGRGAARLTLTEYLFVSQVGNQTSAGHISMNWTYLGMVCLKDASFTMVSFGI